MYSPEAYPKMGGGGYGSYVRSSWVFEVYGFQGFFETQILKYAPGILLLTQGKYTEGKNIDSACL